VSGTGGEPAGERARDAGRADVVAQLAAQRIVPVLRTADVEDAVATARACAAAGLRAIELTRTTPDVERALEALREDGLLLGLGTVTDRAQVAAAAHAGARFVVSFHAPAGMVAEAHAHGLAAIPGAFTPGGLYGISKLGLVSATVTLATSLGPLGINVNAIAPGLVMNDAGYRSLAEDSPIRAAIAAGIPGKKTAPAEDLVGALLLLASDAGAWINGQTISVDGGWVMRL